MSSDQPTITQAILVAQDVMVADRATMQLALFDTNGDPVAPNFTPTGEEVVLTGYAPGVAEAIIATDTVNEAIGKLETKVNTHDDGSDMVLTGYETVTAGDVSATDTVNEAIGKLEARLAALEAS